MGDQEREIKFYLSNPEAFLEKMNNSNGVLTHPRVNEWNLRFDTPQKSLSARRAGIAVTKR